MSIYSNKEIEDLGEDIGKMLSESKYPKTYLYLFISTIFFTTGCVYYILLN